MLGVKKLSLQIGNKQILSDISFDLKAGEVIVIAGGNGAGKSSLLRAIDGQLNYTGEVIFNHQIIDRCDSTERSKRGIFLSYQEPVNIPGLTYSAMLRAALEDNDGFNLPNFQLKLAKTLELLKLDPFAAEKEIGHVSGGEKKKMELLQLLMLEPKLALLDEIDSGLDIDNVALFSELLNDYVKCGNSLILVTHSFGILKCLDVNKVLILNHGKLIKDGDKSLIEIIRNNGLSECINEN